MTTKGVRNCSKNIKHD